MFRVINSTIHRRLLSHWFTFVPVLGKECVWSVSDPCSLWLLNIKRLFSSKLSRKVQKSKKQVLRRGERIDSVSSTEILDRAKQKQRIAEYVGKWF